MDVPTGHRYVAIAQLLAGVLMLAGIWVGLPRAGGSSTAFGSALALACLASAGGLLAGRAWAKRLALVISWATLAIGARTVSALCLRSRTSPARTVRSGAGGAMLLGTIAALVLPYLVGLPVLQLAWLRRQE